jgi:hypothetical protein
VPENTLRKRKLRFFRTPVQHRTKITFCIWCTVLLWWQECLIP